jgi:hypothetical protein
MFYRNADVEEGLANEITGCALATGGNLNMGLFKCTAKYSLEYKSVIDLTLIVVLISKRYNLKFRTACPSCYKLLLGITY